MNRFFNRSLACLPLFSAGLLFPSLSAAQELASQSSQAASALTTRIEVVRFVRTISIRNALDNGSKWRRPTTARQIADTAAAAAGQVGAVGQCEPVQVSLLENEQFIIVRGSEAQTQVAADVVDEIRKANEEGRLADIERCAAEERERAIVVRPVYTYDDSELRERIACLERENEQLRCELAGRDRTVVYPAPIRVVIGGGHDDSGGRDWNHDRDGGRDRESHGRSETDDHRDHQVPMKPSPANQIKDKGDQKPQPKQDVLKLTDPKQVNRFNASADMKKELSKTEAMVGPKAK